MALIFQYCAMARQLILDGDDDDDDASTFHSPARAPTAANHHQYDSDSEDEYNSGDEE